MRFSELVKIYKSKKDFKIDDLDDLYFIDMKGKIKIDFLKLMQLDIDSRE